MLTGGFNSKVKGRSGSETCIGQWSKGRQNQNGTNLVEFCEKKMVNLSQIAASNTLQSTSQPGRKDELTW